RHPNPTGCAPPYPAARHRGWSWASARPHLELTPPALGCRKAGRPARMYEMDDRLVYLFDSTLRDGAQTQGVDFSVADKLAIAEALDRFGIDYVEGGWPGANPTDDAF